MESGRPAERADCEREAVAMARELAPLIRRYADAAERDRTLPEPVVSAFRERGVFHACRPRELGGRETDPLASLALFEELSRADGSAGWCAMIGGAGGVIESFIPRAGAEAMYRDDPRAVTTGVLAPSGRATPARGGFRLTGRWAFASGCMHSDWLGASAVIADGEAPHAGAGGRPETIVGMMPASACELHDTWHVSGLCGTGSHDFEARDVFVPDSRCIRLPMGDPEYPGPLFRFPFFGFLAGAIASTALGIARASIDELVALAANKTPFGSASRLAARPSAQLAIADAEADLCAGRAYLLDAVGRTWTAVRAGRAISLGQRARVRLAAAHAVSSAVRAVDAMYTAGGASALYSTSRLQRCLRDIHAITQHFAVAPPTREMCGRVLLGDDEADVSLL